jgi:hypothetical protein
VSESESEKQALGMSEEDHDESQLASRALNGGCELLQLLGNTSRIG